MFVMCAVRVERDMENVRRKAEAEPPYLSSWYDDDGELFSRLRQNVMMMMETRRARTRWSGRYVALRRFDWSKWAGS